MELTPASTVRLPVDLRCRVSGSADSRFPRRACLGGADCRARRRRRRHVLPRPGRGIRRRRGGADARVLGPVDGDASVTQAAARVCRRPRDRRRDGNRMRLRLGRGQRTGDLRVARIALGADARNHLAGPDRPHGATGVRQWTMAAHSRSAVEAQATGLVDELVPGSTLERAVDGPPQTASARPQCAAMPARVGADIAAIRSARRASTRSRITGGMLRQPSVQRRWQTFTAGSRHGPADRQSRHRQRDFCGPGLGERARRSDGPRAAGRVRDARPRLGRSSGGAVGRR